ncbi:MAG: PrsW family glutamic-type intramembrane protease [Sphingomicrobium sp.]
MSAQIIHWGLALVPVLVMLGLFRWLDAFELMSMREIMILLALGGVAAIACYPISGRMIDTLPIGFSNYSRYFAPWIEEIAKGLIVVALFRFNKIGYKLDAVISGFAIGAGFSLIENIIYLMRLPDFGAGTWLVRGLGTAVMHGTTVAILAASAQELAERENREHAGEFDFRLWWFLPGLLAAVAIHTSFNQFPDQPMLAMMGIAMVAPVLIIFILNFGTSEAQAWLGGEVERHRAELAAFDSGGWPEGKATARVVALAERIGPAKAQHIRDYWRTQAYLVVEAEESLIEESEGDVKLDSGKVRSAFADLDRLRRELGKSTASELSRLLPFSRNDQWEVNELRQRIGRTG